ncbi:MAG: hypothetical protein EXS06_11940 [Planctomycetaceae bacterium]|nr:hypothetical protein [Planctomycetaceae bacterium]
MVVSAPWGTVAGIEVPGYHNPDRLDPARHIGDAREAALRENLIVIAVASFRARCRFAAGLLNPEEIEPFVILVVSAGHRGEVVLPATRQTRRRAEFRLRAAAPPRGAAP